MRINTERDKSITAVRDSGLSCFLSHFKTHTHTHTELA